MAPLVVVIHWASPKYWIAAAPPHRLATTVEIKATAHSPRFFGNVITITTIVASTLAPPATAAGPPKALKAAAPAAPAAALPLIGSDIQTPRNEKARSGRAKCWNFVAVRCGYNLDPVNNHAAPWQFTEPARSTLATRPSASLHMKNENLAFVQALRGIAALMVVLLHVLQLQALPIDDKGLFQWLVGSGSAGVPMFFVISGFIMVYSTKDVNPNARSAFTFAVKRFSRIWPTYVVLTIAFWVIVKLADRTIGAVFPYSFGAMIRSIAFIPLGLDSQPAPILGGSVLHPGWSLNYEMYFYLLLTVCMFFGRFMWPLLLLILSATLLGLPLMNGQLPALDMSSKYGFTSYLALVSSPLIWEFAAGVLIGLLYLSRFKIENKGLAIFLCFFSSAVVVWVLLSKVAWGMGVNGWGWSLILMFLCFAICSKTISIPAPKSLVWLGNVSYSLYLVHPFFIKPVFDIGWETPYREALRDPSFALVVVAASIGAAALSRKYLELGLSDYLRSKILAIANTSRSESKAAGAA
ncbi:acyltransferase family protein [Ralstonia edaphi]|nr:acyltransferase [Ralstonia sp. LMG 6871]